MIQKIKEKLYWIKRVYNLIFTYPRYDLTNKEADYDAYWESKRGSDLGHLSSWQRERADFSYNIIKNEKSSPRVIDVGCGDGAVLVYLKNKLDIQPIGIDVSNQALKVARGAGINTKHADVSNANTFADLPKGEYYTLFEILEHTPHPEALLKVAYQNSTKGVFFSFPNSGYYPYRLRLLFGRFPMQWRVNPSEHLRFWTMKDLKWWLRALKYKDYQIKTYRGTPVLNKIWPSLFAAAFVVYINKTTTKEDMDESILKY